MSGETPAAPATPARPSRFRGRRSFGPVVLLGLVGAGLAAWSAHHTWVAVQGPTQFLQLSGVPVPENLSRSMDGDGYASSLALTFPGLGESPLAGAVGLVALACWGALLVTRGRVRRALAVLGALSALGLLATVAYGVLQLPDDVAATLDARGTQVATSVTVWPWLTAAGAVVSLVASLLAWRLAPQWPEMGRRYDAPTGGGDRGGAGATTADGEVDELALWKAIDEGRDPTA